MSTVARVLAELRVEAPPWWAAPARALELACGWSRRWAL